MSIDKWSLYLEYEEMFMYMGQLSFMHFYFPME